VTAESIDAGEGGHLRFSVHKHAGDFFVATDIAHPPMRLAPPSKYLDASTSDASITLCGGAHAEGRVYLGILGGAHCASQEASVERFSGNCTSDTTFADGAIVAAPLSPGHFT